MKYLIVFFLLNTAYAQAPGAATEAVSTEERETFLEAINDLQIESQLAESDAFEACKQEAAQLSSAPGSTVTEIKAFEDCMGSDRGIGGVDEDSLKQLSEDLSLASFNRNAAESPKTIREYLTKRLKKALYGTDEEGLNQLKERNFVDHRTFYQLYAEQIGKNTLLEVSRYCLENVNYGKKTQIPLAFKGQGNNGKAGFFVSLTDEGAIKAKNATNMDVLHEYEFDEGKVEKITKPGNGSTPISDFFRVNKPKETDLCNLSSQKRCREQLKKKRELTVGSTGQDADKLYMNLNLIAKRKELEFRLASKFGGQDPSTQLGTNYEFCAVYVVKGMCNLFKCNNVYSDSGPEFQRECGEIYGIGLNPLPPGVIIPNGVSVPNTPNNQPDGQLACNLVQRLADYRKVLAATNSLLQDESLLASGGGFRLQDVLGHNRTFDSNGSMSVDELTSIRSGELVDEVSSLSESEDKAQELIEQCFQDPNDLTAGLKPGSEDENDCQTLLATLDKESFENISKKEISLAEIQKQKLEQLKDAGADLDGLITYLQQNNMTEFLEKQENGTFKGKFAEMAKASNLDGIIAGVRGEIEAREQATIEGIKQRFFNETRISDDEPDSEEFENFVAEEAVGNIKNHKERVRQLFEYSNIVSSYLTITDKDGEVVGQSSQGRATELRDMDSDSVLAQYFSSGDDDSASSGSSESINYLDAIDAIVGVSETQEESSN